MKVVFPCEGALVLLKQDLETLQAFYNTNLLTSKMLETYQNSSSMIQVGNFNYIPQKASIVLNNANVLTIDEMRKILGIYREPELSTSETTQEELDEINSSPILDEDFLSNPFFQTLKPLN